jgi:tagaturonate epimerase
MTTQLTEKLLNIPNVTIIPQSIANKDDAVFAAARAGDVMKLVMLAPAGSPTLSQFEGTQQDHEGGKLLIGPNSARNIASLRSVFSWLNPQLLGLRRSVGFGDRLGVATPGHIRALRAGPGNFAPIFAQQSIREMTRTGRSAQVVMDDAVWGVFVEGWQDGFGADADHLKTTADIDVCSAAGFTFYTIDPGEYVNNDVETMTADALKAAWDALPWSELQDTPEELLKRYVNKTFNMEGHTLSFTDAVLMRAAVKYGRVVTDVAMMYRHLAQVRSTKPFEMEVSVDETESPTTHPEHLYIASELRRLQVKWVSLAPRYIGRFEKGVDYIGDLTAFEADFAVHAALSRYQGTYKLSLHSGSDKFSIYGIAAKHTKGVLHLKTAGTNWLEALRTVADADPAFFRSIYEFSCMHYEEDRATYHVSAQLDRAPKTSAVKDADLVALIDQFDARQILHVTFGSVLKADNGQRFYPHLMQVLNVNPEVYAVNLERHLKRHLDPFGK